MIDPKRSIARRMCVVHASDFALARHVRSDQLLAWHMPTEIDQGGIMAGTAEITEQELARAETGGRDPLSRPLQHMVHS